LAEGIACVWHHRSRLIEVIVDSVSMTGPFQLEARIVTSYHFTIKFINFLSCLNIRELNEAIPLWQLCEFISNNLYIGYSSYIPKFIDYVLFIHPILDITNPQSFT